MRLFSEWRHGEERGYAQPSRLRQLVRPPEEGWNFRPDIEVGSGASVSTGTRQEEAGRRTGVSLPTILNGAQDVVLNQL
jgi:hypothetical protein